MTSLGLYVCAEELLTSCFIMVYTRKFNFSHSHYLEFLDSSTDQIGFIYRKMFVLDMRFSFILKMETGWFETLVLIYHKTVSYPRTCRVGISVYSLTHWHTTFYNTWRTYKY